MTDSTALPPALLGWAQKQVGTPLTVSDASHPRENSRVWELVRRDGVRFYLKVSPQPLMYQRETFALRSAVPALGAGTAPQLWASNAEHLALLLTAVRGRPLKELTLTPAQECAAYRQGGVLLARLHAAGDLSGPRRREAERTLQDAADGADRHLEKAGDRLTPAEHKLVRDLADQLRLLPPLPLAFIHGDAWARNLMWSGELAQAGWVDFERSCFAPAVQEFVPLSCGVWADRPDLRTACLRGYGRGLSAEELHALKGLAALDAVSCLVWGPAHDDPEVTARGRRTLDRLMTGVFA
jgi:Ser/Thr protein kinase RdoA (MazF antagonist)